MKKFSIALVTLVALLAISSIALVFRVSAMPIVPPEPLPNPFKAMLGGDQEVPPVVTDAAGHAQFLAKDSKVLFEVTVRNIAPVFAAHIHCGAKGVNGPVGITLYQKVKDPFQGSGILAKGVIMAPKPGNACGWADLDAVVSAMQSGDTYVNVHTAVNSGGEIRGQIIPLPPGD